MRRADDKTFFDRFLRTEAASGLLLLGSATAALAAANSPWADAYARLWHASIAVGVAPIALSLTVHQWINDALMAVFFLLVGLEIKREIVAGELASIRQAAFPIAGAVGGMLLPALVYTIFNHGGEGARGWAIPMATDIAFAIGTLALVAPAVPPGAKVFLTALAIVDDMGAIVVIAIFFTSGIDWAALLFAGAVVAALAVLNATRVERLAVYLIAGALLWWFILASGIHATIAGVLLALTIPASTTRRNAQAPLVRLERALHGISAYGIMPVFAFANAGVRLGGAPLHWPIVLGVGLGLALGKSIGITGGAWTAAKTGIGALPSGVRWATLHGCAWVGGIGLTMSLFIAALAFEGTAALDSAKIGILAGSCVSGLVALGAFRLTGD